MAKPKLRSLPGKYTPGFLRQMDRRTELSERLRVAFDNITTDAGGADDLAHVKLALVERFVFLEAMLSTLENEIVNSTDTTNQAELVGRWTAAVNTLVGLSKAIGLDRKVPKTDLRAHIATAGKRS